MTIADQQTQSAVLNWDYDLLSQQEAMLLRRASVFAGDASLNAVEEVCSGNGLARDNISGLLGSLVTKSLLVTDTARARYRLPEAIRMYSRQRLDEHMAELTDTTARQAKWCVALVESSWHQVTDGDALTWVRQLEVEHDNLRAALHWLAANDRRTGLRVAAALTLFWKMSGCYEEGRQWLVRMLEVDEPSLGATSARAEAAVRACALCGLGMLEALQGDISSARRSGDASLRLARSNRLVLGEVVALNTLASISLTAEDAHAAKPLAEESVALARAVGDESSVATNLALLGRAHLLLTELKEAQAAFEECESLSGVSSASLIGYGWVAMLAGEERNAGHLFMRALGMLNEVGDQFESSLVRGFLGELSWAQGDLVNARTRLENGVETARSVGSPSQLVQCLSSLARVAQSEGRHDEARGLVDESCTLARSKGLNYSLTRSLLVRGGIRGATGDGAGASSDYQEARTLAEPAGDRDGVARSLSGLARLARARGADQQAIGALREALAMEREMGRGRVPGSLEMLAGIDAHRGRAAHAAELFDEAEAIREAHGVARRPDEVDHYAADVAHLRSILDPDELAAAWAKGAACG